MAGKFSPNIAATSFNRYSSSSNIRIKFPFLPSGALRLGQDRLPDLPHATPEDLLALKINSSGLRATIEKRTVDAADADALAEMLLGRGPIVLTAEEPSIIFLSEAERITLLRGAGSTYNAR